MSETTNLENCPSCGHATASHLFRAVGEKKLCLPCAQRADDWNKSSQALHADKLNHGGGGWFWKYVGYVAAITIGGMVIRHFVIHYYQTH